MGYLLMLLNCFMAGISTVMSKNYVTKTASFKSSKTIYILLAHPLAAIYFFIMSGGNVPLNSATLLFSTFYAFSCLISVIISLKAYEKTNLIYMSVFSGAGAVIVPLIAELIQKTHFTTSIYFSVVARLIAVGVPLFFSSSVDKKGLGICIAMFFSAGAGGIIPKLYAQSSAVTTNESFCFWTNIIILPIVFLIIMISNDRKEILFDMKKMKPKHYAPIFICTAISNVSSIIMLHVLTLVDATVRAVFVSSVGMLVTSIISVFVFKEKFTIVQLISIVFSLAAVVLSVL
ncbi:MAG: EamA family transporter [Clostridia bacterium]|nr:EamA family transporter [Clostridia bacterium]